jgi:UDP-N-acetylmuramoyl-tripeptide--D-alanyl-D-alanine ligase
MMKLSEVALAVHGVHEGPDVTLSAVCTDSRSVPPGALFVALAGEKFDGHDYVHSAAAAGAAAALVEQRAPLRQPGAALPLIRVEDSRKALAALATYWRGRFHGPTIGIVGSNGKTTTKEMTAAILRAALGGEAVLATEGNLNNDIGLPLTILRLRPQHRVAVFEIGMNHPGETAQLAAIAQPTIALVNNAQREHQEFMVGVQAVAEEHAALIDALPADGVAVLNADDPYYRLWRERASSRAIVSFGLQPGAVVHGRFAPSSTGSAVSIELGAQRLEVQLHIPGEHNVRNALGAAAAACQAGAGLDAVQRGLGAFVPAKGRLQISKARGDALLIDDTYNANPDSVRAAIDVLAGTGAQTVLVLGDMGEVGAQGDAMHAELGDYARTRGINRLLTLGKASACTAQAFGPGAQHFAALEPLLERLEGLLAPQVAVLVKGSRFMRMERVVAAVAAAPELTAHGG